MSGHEGELKAALRQLPVPDASPDLLRRILHSRAMGKRITFPTRDSTAPWRWIAAAAVVTVLISGSWVVSLSLSKLQESRAGGARDQLAELLRDTRLWPSPGGGEETLRVPARPKYALILSDALSHSRMIEGVWTYQSTTTTDDVLTQPSGATRLRLARATYAGRPAWTVNTARQLRAGGWTEFMDTTYLDASTLRPQHAVTYANKRRTRLVQTFSADSAHESIDITGPMQRSWRGAIAFPFPREALFFNDWSTDRLAALFPAIPLARGWRGTLYQVAFISRVDIRSFAPLDLRVVGTDRVTVPAGTFDCWRLEVETHLWGTERSRMWVSRDRGWLIKTQSHGSDYVVNEVLEAVTSPEPR